MIHPLLLNKQFDLVDFGDVKLLMFQHDNLYDNMVSEGRKHQDMRAFCIGNAERGYALSPVNPQNVGGINSSQYGIYLYLQFLWQQNVEFTVLDIGSHVGDFSIKIGNFIRTWGKNNKVIAFDPTEAGALVPYNIKLNGLDSIVSYEDAAVYDYNGYMCFTAREGLTDSTSSELVPKTKPGLLTRAVSFFKSPQKWESLLRYLHIIPPPNSRQILVSCVNIEDYVNQHNLKGNLFVKIDIEGQEEKIFRLLKSKSKDRLVSFILEYTISDAADLEAARSILREYQSEFIVYDIYYSPNPTRFKHICENDVNTFTNEVLNRPYSYTDILLIPKSCPNIDKLIQRLDSLKMQPDKYEL